MKTYFEVSIANRGSMERHTFPSKRKMDKWLVEYFTTGDGSYIGKLKYIDYTNSTDNPMPLKKFVKKYIVNGLKNLKIYDKFMIILEKTLDKHK